MQGLDRHARHEPELNQDVVTAFPVIEAVGAAGARRLRDDGAPRPPARRRPTSDYDASARRSGSSSPISASPPSRARTASTSSCARSRAPSRSPASRSGSSPATTRCSATQTTDANGHAASIPASRAARAAWRRASSSRRRRRAITASSTSAARLRPDRPRRRRAAPRPAPSTPIVYTERGVYRSGETVYLTALLRDAKGAAVAGLPLTLVVEAPRRRRVPPRRVEDQGLGGRALVAAAALRRRCAAPGGSRPIADPKGPAIGETRLPGRGLRAGAPRRDAVAEGAGAAPGRAGRDRRRRRAISTARRAPASTVTGDVVVQAAGDARHPGLDGYARRPRRRAVEAVHDRDRASAAPTDAARRASRAVPVPTLAAPPAARGRDHARASARTGGRAVERCVTLPILPDGPGDRRAQAASATTSRRRHRDLRRRLAPPDGERLAAPGVAWTPLPRRAALPMVQHRRPLGLRAGQVDAPRRRRPRSTSTADDAGPHRGAGRLGPLPPRGRAPTASTPRRPASPSRSAGRATETADTPDLLDVTLDKAAYAAGETMQAAPRRRASPARRRRGRRRPAARLARRRRRRPTAPPSTSRSRPNGAPAPTSSRSRTGRSTARRSACPAARSALAWFEVDRERARARRRARRRRRRCARAGRCAFRSGSPALQPGEEAYVTVAAVDVGILNLTRYERPIRSSTSSASGSSATEIRDLYGFLIDGMQGTRGAIRSGGDAAAAASQGTPPTEEPLARYSGVVEVGPDGTATVDLRHPGLQRHRPRHGDRPGRSDRVGQRQRGRDRPRSRRARRHAAALPRRRRPLALPRRRSTTSRAPAGDYTSTSTSTARWSSPADALRRPSARAGARSAGSPSRSPAAGRRRLRRRRRDAAPAPDVEVAAEPSRSRVAARRPPASCAAPCGRWRPARASPSRATSSPTSCPAPARCRSRSSPLAALDVPALLQALDRYPYGCTEQTVSRALPLLYVNELARDEALALDAEARRARARRDRARARPPGLQRLVRPVGRRRRRPLARRLRHRLPDPGARARLRGAAAAPSTSRSTGCATASPTPTTSRQRRRGHRLRALRAGPQRPRR